MKFDVNKIIPIVQAEADHQTGNNANAFSTHGSTIQVHGGKMCREEWREFGQDFIDLIKEKFDVDYVVQHAGWESVGLMLDDPSWENFEKETLTMSDYS